uniref:Uncharacterized protein n=1 Tax=Anguilla anguilla TaxID=7936 RepID=A0A0E9RBZ4_ANGAN
MQATPRFSGIVDKLIRQTYDKKNRNRNRK